MNNTDFNTNFKLTYRENYGKFWKAFSFVGGGGGGRLKASEDRMGVYLPPPPPPPPRRTTASEERMGVYLPPQDSLNTEKTDEFTSTCKILFNM